MKTFFLVAIVLVVSMFASADIYNYCNNLDEFSTTGYAAGDWGIHTPAVPLTPDGGTSFFFVPRPTNNHVASWNFADVTFNPGDTFTFDIKNTISLNTANVAVRYIVDDGSGGDTILAAASLVTLSTNDWVHVTCNTPTTTKLLKRIDWAVTENTKIIDLDNLKLIAQYPLGTGLYTYGPIYNPCDSAAQFTICEGGIVNDLNGNHVQFIPRATNNHSLSWDIGDINVTPSDFLTFDVMNNWAFPNATLRVNLFWRNSLGNTGVTGPMIVGLTDGHLIDSAGWKHCRVSMLPFPGTITDIVFSVDENVKIVTLDNLAISPEFLPQDCNQVNAAGLVLSGDITKDCYVDMNDVEALAFDWVQNTDPYSPNHVIGNATPTNKIVRGTAVVDGSIADWSNQVEWVPLDKVYYGTPTDVNGAKMALRWSEATNKIYAAVVVPDTTHFFTDSYDASWDSSDRIEVFSQGDASGGAYTTGTSDAAQQYFVGHKTIATGGSWVSWANGFVFMGVPDPNFEYAVSINGNNLVYEVGVQMYDNYAGRPGSEGDTIITDLSLGKVVGFDIVVDARRGNNLEEFGVLAANLLTGKSANASNFQTYTLIEQAECGALGYLDGDANRDCYVDFNDFAELALDWLQCNEPTDLSCTPNW